MADQRKSREEKEQEQEEKRLAREKEARAQEPETFANVFGADLGKIIDGVKGQFDALATPLAKLTDVIGGASNPVLQFVGALSPSLVAQFQESLQNLFATIGTAFEPFLEVLNEIVKEISGILLPVMEQLRPVFQSIAEAFGAVLVPIVKVLAAILQILAPILQIIAELFKAIAPVLDAVAVVLKTFAETVGELIKTLAATGIFKFLADVFKKIADTFLILVASIAKLVGAMGFLQRLIDNLKPPEPGALAAIRNVSIKSFEQISRDLAVASAGAAGKAQLTPEERDRKEMIAKLEAIRDGQSVLQEILEWIKAIANKIGVAIKDFVRGAAETITRPMIEAWRWARGMFGG